MTETTVWKRIGQDNHMD